MNFHFRKSLKNEIAARMAAELPQFEPVKDHKEPIYSFLTNENLHFFIRFQSSEKYRHEAFTVELAWSPEGRWPEAADLSIPVDIPDRDLIRTRPESGGAYRFRIGFLFPPHKDHWWELTPRDSLEAITDRLANPDADGDIDASDGNKNIKPSSLVSDAVIKIRDYGLPFLKNEAPC